MGLYSFQSEAASLFELVLSEKEKRMERQSWWATQSGRKCVHPDCAWVAWLSCEAVCTHHNERESKPFSCSKRSAIILWLLSASALVLPTSLHHGNLILQVPGAAAATNSIFLPSPTYSGTNTWQPSAELFLAPSSFAEACSLASTSTLFRCWLQSWDTWVWTKIGACRLCEKQVSKLN